jgi:hypothetical protein
MKALNGLSLKKTLKILSSLCLSLSPLVSYIPSLSSLIISSDDDDDDDAILHQVS